MNKKGFTLIELLVVISIIGLLSSVTLAAIQSARTKADDTQRNRLAEEYQKALTLYYDDHDSYPYPAGLSDDWRCLGDYIDNICGFVSQSWPQGTIPEESQINNALTPQYFSVLPLAKPFTFDFLGDLETFEGPIYKCFSYSSLTPPRCEEGLLQWMLTNPSSICAMGATQFSWEGDPLGITCNLHIK